MRKVFLSFLGKIGQVLEVLINPGEARVGSEVSGLGKNFPSMVSIIHRQKSTSPPNLWILIIIIRFFDFIYRIESQDIIFWLAKPQEKRKDTFIKLLSKQTDIKSTEVKERMTKTNMMIPSIHRDR